MARETHRSQKLLEPLLEDGVSSEKSKSLVPVGVGIGVVDDVRLALLDRRMIANRGSSRAASVPTELANRTTPILHTIRLAVIANVATGVTVGAHV
ncbi:uncharacterized protein LAJ45_09545 [Morchella importuna]|uniref:uncharacterized protein n=1 Tax=Morchella importuna TaxID=1174673 RepID=UPI001E8D6D41|nr:uncharacterized protein LAJ45_09545 [Morchella importuna]KAH8146352.1 hypothetical protein LAJ45_09545 [Morchella importuna]